VEEKVKVSVYPLKKECVHRGIMTTTIEFKPTHEEKKGKYFWLAMWRLNRKTTGKLLLRVVINVMNGTDIIAFKKER
jgi:hypothetical protein